METVSTDITSSQAVSPIEYKESAVLGRGYFGIVFEGRWNNQDVAVKRIQVAALTTKPSEASEQIAMDRVNHENVIRCFDSYRDDKFRYYALELCQASMRQLFSKTDSSKHHLRNQLPPDVIVLLQLARGLEHIHSKQLAHRDIHPDNVLIYCPDGQSLATMKWSDFGLAKKTNDAGYFTMGSGPKGNMYWRAPELGQGSPELGSSRTDVFSAGCVCFYFLTRGVHPFGLVDDIIANIRDSKQVNRDHLSTKHFAYGLIQDMIVKDTKVTKRITSAEVVRRLDSLKADREKELIKHCSLSNPSPTEVHRLGLLIREGVADRNCKQEGLTPLLLLCEKNSTDDLVSCLQLLLERDGIHPEYAANVNAKNERYDWNALHYLCRHYIGNRLLDVVSFLIERGIKFKATDKKGMNALQVFCQREDDLAHMVEFIRLLTEHGLDVNDTDNDGWNALHHLCLYYKGVNLLQIIELFHELGVNLNTTTGNNGYAVLHILCEECADLKGIIEWLILRKIDLRLKTRDHRNALHLVCAAYREDDLHELIKLLTVGDGAIDVNDKDQSGFSALDYLCQYYRNDNLPKAITALIESGLDVYEKEGKVLRQLCRSCDINTLIEHDQAVIKAILKQQSSRTLIHLLCRYINDPKLFEVMKLMIDNGVGIDAVDDEGKTALHILCESYRHDNLSDIVELLVTKGMDLNAKDLFGQNALHYLCQMQYTTQNVGNVLSKLSAIAEGSGVTVAINSTDNVGQNLLHLLCKRYREDDLINIVAWLLRKGIDVNAKESIDGKNALHLLCKYYTRSNLLELVKLLMSNRIDVTATDRHRKTASCYLEEFYLKDNKELIQKLLNPVQQQ